MVTRLVGSAQEERMLTSKQNRAELVLAGTFAVVALALAGHTVVQHLLEEQAAEAALYGTGQGKSVAPLPPGVVPGVTLPHIQKGAGAILSAQQQVVGVVVDGRARAYSMRALSFISQHVVNDLVGSVPVTVTYCGISDCLRVFTAEQREPLAVHGAGFDNGLRLMHGDKTYSQATGRAYQDGTMLPLRPLPFERMSWTEWQRLHPKTDVFIGGAYRPAGDL
jgi:hypothetical protein